MSDPTPSNIDLAFQAHPDGTSDRARLLREREDAHQAYHAALAALDDAIRRLREMPKPPTPYDESQIPALNQQWELLKPAAGGGLLSSLRTVIQRLAGPILQQQQAFNATIVDHLNRNAAAHRETVQAIDATLIFCREELEKLVDFETKVILYAQQITPYVDTKDRDVASLSTALAGGLSGLGDELRKRWESTTAWERRQEAQVKEIQTTLGLLQRAVSTLKRELEHRSPAAGFAAALEHAGTAVPPIEHGSLDSYKYVGFEDEFRGSRQIIRERMSAYVKDFAGGQNVLDIGCGRGEFLDLLREAGITARGVDVNDEMAAVCRERGLDAVAGDALDYLRKQPDTSLGGLFAAQVVEHLEPDYLMRLLETAYHKLLPGSKIVLETVNVASWYAFFSSYIRDLTHVRPLHPDTLRYLLVASGFQQVEIRYSAPVSEETKLRSIPSSATGQPLGSAPPSPDTPADAAAIVNENVAKLNDLLFAHLDYAVIGERT